MGNDKRNGAYINFDPGVKALLDSICGLKNQSRTAYINHLIESEIVNTYNSMENRDAVLDAQQAIAQHAPPLPTVFRKLNEKITGVIVPDTDTPIVEEEDEAY